MPKRTAPITKASAINVATWHVERLSRSPETPVFKSLALKAALAGGNIAEIIDEVYKLGFVISMDLDNPNHIQMLNARSIVKEP
jgi:hypothetical protein